MLRRRRVRSLSVSDIRHSGFDDPCIIVGDVGWVPELSLLHVLVSSHVARFRERFRERFRDTFGRARSCCVPRSPRAVGARVGR